MYGLLHSDNYNLSFQGIDMFIYWRQMAPVCPPQRFSSMSKWPAKEFPSRACRSASQWPKARRLDAHQKIAAFSDNKKGPSENLRRSEERKSLLPPAAPPVQNSSAPILHCDPLPGAGRKKKSMPFTRDEAARWLLANECGRIMNGDPLGECLAQLALWKQDWGLWLLERQNKINFIVVGSHIRRPYHFRKVVSCQSLILLDKFFF